VAGDARLHREHLEQRVEPGDRIGVAARGAELEDPPQPALGAAEHGEVFFHDLVAHPGVVLGEQGAQPGKIA
jgi:hypothetical protein